MNKETIVLAIVGLLLVVTVLQGFQLSGFVSQLQSRASAAPVGAYGTQASAPAAQAAAPVSLPRAAPAQVGGC